MGGVCNYLDRVGMRHLSRCLEGEIMNGYKVVRIYFRGGKRTIIARCTLEEAQQHCGDPETSSSTATGAAAKARTRRMGPWFDSYTER